MSGLFDDVFLWAEDLVMQGSLRADQVTRALVPALLEKANKIQRGKTRRTGSSHSYDAAGMQDETANGCSGYLWMVSYDSKCFNMIHIDSLCFM